MTKDELLIYRRSLGLDQKAFGAALGVSRQAVCNWETGRFSIPPDLVDRMAERGIGTLTPVASSAEQKNAAHIARACADEYGKMRRSPNDWSHRQIITAWADRGYTCPQEAMAIIALEWPDIVKFTNKEGN